MRPGVVNMSYKSLNIWFGMPVALALVWVFAVYMPIRSLTAAHERTLTTVRDDARKLDAEMKGIVAQTQDRKKMSKSYGELVRQAPTMASMPEYIRGIIGMADQRGIVVTGLRGYYGTLEPSGKGLMRPLFEMELRGRFLDLGRLLEDISHKGGYSAVRMARIDGNEKDLSTVTGRFVIEFKALRGTGIESK